MIRCAGVKKAYRLGEREVTALRGFDMEIGQPGFYAVMGPSGSGKSTLLHLLAALDKPDAGEIIIAGRAVHSMGEAQATEYRRRSIGIVFQQFNLIPTLSAIENVELPGLLAGDEPAALRTRARELLDQLGVGERLGHRPDALSGGEQQRVAIARALMAAPPVILADEPTGNLDTASSERLWGLLGGLAHERGLVIVMVTHEPAAAAHCRSAYILKDGVLHGQIETEGLDAAGVASRYQQCLR
ncbi:MAG: ABC transporter ATP-binding protein [Planctomycetota bacterium]